MFYKGHFIRDTSSNSGKNKGQGLVSSEKIRDKNCTNFLDFGVNFVNFGQKLQEIPD